MAAPKSQLPLIIMASVSVTLAIGAVVYVMLQRSSQPVSTAAATPARQPAPQASAQPTPPSATPLPAPYGTKARTFTYKNPTAKSVKITGNFNQWQPEPMEGNNSGAWSLTKELPRGVAIEYQYIVDGTKMPDPEKSRNAVADEEGVLKSVFTIPKTDPTPRQAAATPTPVPSPSPDVVIAPGLMGTASGTLPPADVPSQPAAVAAPEAVDLNALAATPANWPKTVTLKQAGVVFPVVINGKPAGEIQGTAGMQVTLIKVTPDQLTVSFQGSVQTVPVNSTDLSERVQAARKR